MHDFHGADRLRGGVRRQVRAVRLAPTPTLPLQIHLFGRRLRPKRLCRYILPEKDLFNKYKYEEKEITENDIQQSLLGHDNESAPTRGGPLSLNAS